MPSAGVEREYGVLAQGGCLFCHFSHVVYPHRYTQTPTPKPQTLNLVYLVGIAQPSTLNPDS